MNRQSFRFACAAALALACAPAWAQQGVVSAHGGDGGGVAAPSDTRVARGGANGQAGENGFTIYNLIGTGGGGGGASAQGGSGYGSSNVGAGGAGGAAGIVGVNAGRGANGGSTGSDSSGGGGGGGGGASCYVGVPSAWTATASCAGGAGGDGGGSQNGYGGGGGGGGNGVEFDGAGIQTAALTGQLVGGAGGAGGAQGYIGVTGAGITTYAALGGSGGAGLLLSDAINGLTLGSAGIGRGGAGGSATSNYSAGSSGANGANGAYLGENPCTNGSNGGPASAARPGALPSQAGVGGAGAELVAGAGITNGGKLTGGAGGGRLDVLQPNYSGGNGGSGGTGADGGYGPGGNGCSGGNGGSGSPGLSGLAGSTGGPGAQLDGSGAVLTNQNLITGGSGGVGTNGASGGPGGVGGKGGNGGVGSVGGYANYGNGGDGGKGGNGGNGGDGGSGGNGGTGVAMTGGATLHNVSSPSYGRIKGGTGGTGGSAGGGGNAGAGGAGGTTSTSGGAHNGSQGAPGSNGAPGNGSFGGNGGNGVVASTGDNVDNTGIIQGGDGGASPSGTGGSGGIGIAASGSTIGNSGSGAIFGGNGVTSASGGGGNGGIGIQAESSSTITNSASGLGAGIAGGAGASGASYSGASGGNGGTALVLQTASTAQVSNGNITGGAGGAGGSGPNTSFGGSGGAAGSGGNGVSVSGASSMTVAANAMVSAGTGGVGGDCTLTIKGRSQSGNGGAGGAGVVLDGSSLNNFGAITGASGGVQGAATNGCQVGTVGAGGSGIVENGGSSVILVGSVAGGFKGGSTAEVDRAPAIALHNGGNSLSLIAGFAITGNVVSDSGSANGGDTLGFGGANDVAGFDLGQIASGGKYSGFAKLRMLGTDTWQFTGNNTAFTGPTQVSGGTMQVDGVLSGSAVTVQGGTLSGAGSVGDVTNNATVMPGTTGTLGTLHAASYTGSATGTLQINAHPDTVSASALSVSGTATLTGSKLFFKNNSLLLPGQSYTIVQAGALSGTFASVLTLKPPSLSVFIDYGVITPNAVTLTFDRGYAIGGTINGASGPVSLRLDGANPASTQTQSASNGNFTFTNVLRQGSNWSVSVASAPSGQACSVSNGSGSGLSGDVGNVTVDCGTGYGVTASVAGGHGTITPASQGIISGNAASFTVTPNAGFEVLSVTGDTCAIAQQGTSTTWTTNAITQACSVTAVFADYPSQCTGARNYGASFFDDFSGNTLDPSRWTAYSHGGNLVVADNSVAVSAGSGLPYVTSAGSPIPTGNFSVRWIAAYGTQANWGTGSLALTDVLPADGTQSWSNVADAWQDSGGYRVEGRVADVGTVTSAYSVPSPTAVPHDVEYCWLAGATEVWVDGQLQLQATRNANVPRPTALWFGNPGATGSGPWQPFTLYYVEVRALNDEIFKDGFGNN